MLMTVSPVSPESSVASNAPPESPRRPRSPRRAALLVVGVMGVVPLATTMVVTVPTAAASPVVPDNLPVFPDVTQDPEITVTTADGTPVTADTVVHRGDVLYVHGTGFSPEANRGGFPMPVPPGVPNGVFVLYGAFPDGWRASEGAPEEARTHPHDRMAWVMPDASLNAVPDVPIDMRRTIAREAQTMNQDGSFTAELVVDPPEETAGDNFGVYVYAGGGSVNAAEEIYVPLAFSEESGPNTPPPSAPDLSVDASVVAAAADAAGGKLNAKDGALDLDGDTVSFTRDTDAEDAAGDGTVRYRGAVHVTARFSLVDVAVKVPRIERRGDRNVLTASVSTPYNAATDTMRRVEIGQLPDGVVVADGTVAPGWYPVTAGIDTVGIDGAPDAVSDATSVTVGHIRLG